MFSIICTNCGYVHLLGLGALLGSKFAECKCGQSLFNQFQTEHSCERRGQLNNQADKRFIEVEVGNLGDYQAALNASPDAILLDNMSYAEISRAVKLRAESFGVNPKLLLEVSGGVTLNTVRPIAKTGVERISIGRLTHSAPWFDVSLKVITESS